jgi:hypothetical protein
MYILSSLQGRQDIQSASRDIRLALQRFLSAYCSLTAGIARDFSQYVNVCREVTQ